MKNHNNGERCAPNDAKCASKKEQCGPNKAHCAPENKGRDERHEKNGASNGRAEHNKFGK